MAGATPDFSSGKALLYLRDDCAELVVQDADGCKLVRHLAPPKLRGLGATLDDVRRALALLPAVKSGSPRSLLVWDELGLDGSVSLQERLGLPVHICNFPQEFSWSILPEPAGAAAKLPIVQLAALAAQGLSEKPPLVDFAHSRLVQTAPVGRRRYLRMALAAAAILLAGAIWFTLDWVSDVRQSANTRSQLAELQPSVAQAQSQLDDISFARQWYDQRSSILECLRQITLAFPQSSRIWATNVSLREEKKLQLVGKCESEQAAMEIRDHLQACQRFANVSSVYIRRAANSSEVTFAISFEFKPEKAER